MVESSDDESIYFLLNPLLSTNTPSLENNELEQMPFVKDKPLHVYKRHTPQLASDLTTMPMSHVPVLDTQSGVSVALSSDNIALDNIHSDLDQRITLRKGK